MRTLIVNSGEIAHMSYGDVTKPLRGPEMGDKEANVYDAGLGILIEDGFISKINDSDSLISEFAPSWNKRTTNHDGALIIDAGGNAIIPGFVDSHTHLIWSGDRSNEMALRQSGLTYSDIADIGGGISKTVSSTRKSTFQELVNIGLDRANGALKLGTTTLEAKSGYGLNTETELSLLEATSKVNENTNCEIHATWLGAHDIPKNMEKKEYLNELINDQLPKVCEQGIAEWADVFCEPGWFTTEETADIIEACNGMGLGSRLHVDEFTDSGGLSLAVEMGSVSADHVACSNNESRSEADKSGVMQTFLAGTQYVLGMKEFPPMRECQENSWAFSIATDFNPNCNTISMPFVGSLATHRCGIDPLSALAASTRNPSTTMGYSGGELPGTISEKSKASLNILKSKSLDSWCQTPGMNPILMTVANGHIVK